MQAPIVFTLALSLAAGSALAANQSASKAKNSETPKPVAVKSTNPPEADLSTLKTWQSPAKSEEKRGNLDRINARGVNCSLYPARCK